MQEKKYLKLSILIFVFAQLVLANINLAYATDPVTPPTTPAASNLPVYSGPESTIRALLCTPTPPAGNTTDVTEITNLKTGPISYNQDSAQRNAAQNDLYNCINKLYRFTLAGSSVVAVFFIVIAGYLYMSSEGNQETVDKAKSILTSSIASIVILFGGYILLRTLNPDIIQLKTIQPPSVVLQAASTTIPTTGAPGTAVYTGTPSGHSFADLPGCVAQTSNQTTEIPRIVEALFQKLKPICAAVAAKALTAQISGIIGLNDHAGNSYHYKGCAIDFGGQNSAYKESAAGQAIISAALSVGITQDRINPAPQDSGRHDIVHIDLGTSCPSPDQPRS